MQCPVDGTTLVMSDRSGVEIDYCPQCRGVWLDRGELDKIIERSVAAPAHVEDTYVEEEERGFGGGKRRKKGGFLSEVFDIFD